MSDSTKVEKNSDKRQKKGGRQKGTPNKSTEHIFKLCEKHDFDPVEVLILLAKKDWEGLGYSREFIERQGFQGHVIEEPVISTDHALDATKTLVAYMYPKRKAIEITNDDKNTGVIFMAYDPKNMKKPDEQG